MGEGFVPLCKLSIRRLVSCQPKVVSNYLAQGEFLFTHHRIREKLDKIDQQWKDLSKEQRLAAVNKVDNEAIKLLLYTERECRKLRTGTVDYSSILSKLGLR